MFSPSVAKILGIKIDTGDRKLFKGLGGDIVAYLHKIPMKVGKNKLTTRVAFPAVEIPNILGRLDIFSKCNVHFIDEDKICFGY